MNFQFKIKESKTEKNEHHQQYANADYNLWPIQHEMNDEMSCDFWIISLFAFSSVFAKEKKKQTAFFHQISKTLPFVFRDLFPQRKYGVFCCCRCLATLFFFKKNYLHIVLLTRQVISSICVYNSVLFLPLLLLCFTTIFAASVFYVLFFVFFFFLFLIINECLIVCHQYFVREFGWVSFAQNAYLLDKQIESKWVCWTKKKSWLIAQHRFKCSYKMDKVKNTRRILIKIYIEDERRRKKPASYRELLNTTIADVIVMW